MSDQNRDPQTGNANLDLLIKLLNMTTSDNDNIALMSARKANEQLLKFRATWESLLRGRVTVVQDPFTSTTAPLVQPKAPPPPSPNHPYQPPRPVPPTTPPFLHPRQVKPAPTPRPTPPPVNNPPPDPDHHLYGKPNTYAGTCFDCQRPVAAGEGVLSGKSPTGKWRVVCGKDKGHNAPHGKRPLRPAPTADSLKDLI